VNTVVCARSSLCVCVCARSMYQGEDISVDLGDRSRIHLDVVNGEDYI
jgi:hypothetical protein